MKYAALCAGLLTSGCDSILKADGSFEESKESGRVVAYEKMYGSGDASHSQRIFRFHVKQFDKSVGGVFETFDMRSYDAFRQTPQKMESPASYFYCARIDNGFVRDNKVYIEFTDREQRQWRFHAPLGKRLLSGSFARYFTTSGQYHEFEVGAEVNELEQRYLMPSDRLYHQYSSSNEIKPIKDEYGKMQVREPGIFNRVRAYERSLDCIYYYSKNEVTVVMPDGFSLESCEPSAQECRSLKLALVGYFAQSRRDISKHEMHEIQSAYLDDIDVHNNQRRFLLRDNPGLYSNSLISNLFVSTIILYRDEDLDGEWDYNAEPVLASLKGQTVAFYDESYSKGRHSRDFSGEVCDEPVLESATSDESSQDDEKRDRGGWRVYVPTTWPSQASWYYGVKTLKSDTSGRLPLSWVSDLKENGEHVGCYVSPDSDDKIPCTDMIPVLIH